MSLQSPLNCSYGARMIKGSLVCLQSLYRQSHAKKVFLREMRIAFRVVQLVAQSHQRLLIKTLKCHIRLSRIRLLKIRTQNIIICHILFALAITTLVQSLKMV